MEIKISVKRDIHVDATNAYTVTIKNDWTGITRTVSVHTDSDGDGLWIDGKQIEGTCQFKFRSPNSYRRYFAQIENR